MTENFRIRPLLKVSTSSASNSLTIPIVPAHPSNAPGSIALFGDVLQVRKTDQSVLTLESGSSLTFANVVSNGNNSGGDVVIGGQLSVTGVLSGTSATLTSNLEITGNNTTKGLLYYDAGGSINFSNQVNCTAIDGALFNSNSTRGKINFTITANGPFSVDVTLPVSYVNGPEFIGVTPDTSGFDPYIRALSTNVVQIGGVNAAGAAAVMSMYYFLSG